MAFTPPVSAKLANNSVLLRGLLLCRI